MTTTEYAKDARRAKSDHAVQIGIDEALVSELVETFYARIRSHDLLGPIFEEHVGDWPTHLQKMKNFWASIAIESGRFHGSPMAKHIALGSLEHGHFDEWLALFSETLDDIVEGEEARAFFQERAARIAESLHMGIQLQRHGLEGPTTTTVQEEE
jgi:hemoglobin